MRADGRGWRSRRGGDRGPSRVPGPRRLRPARPRHDGRDELEAAILYQVGALAAFARAAGVGRSATSSRTAPCKPGRDRPVGGRGGRPGGPPAVARAGPRRAGGLGDARRGARGRAVGRRGGVRGPGLRAGRAAPPAAAPGAVHDDPAAAAAQAVSIARDGRVTAHDGSIVEVRADTLCLHGDTPGAAIARAVRIGLETAGSRSPRRVDPDRPTERTRRGRPGAADRAVGERRSSSSSASDLRRAQPRAHALDVAVQSDLPRSDGWGIPFPAYASLLVPYDPDGSTRTTARERLERVVAATGPAPPGPDRGGRLVEIPVCYGGDDGPDLPEVAARHGLSAEAVVRLHAGRTYRVYAARVRARLRVPRASCRGSSCRAGHDRAAACHRAASGSSAARPPSTRSRRPAAGTSSGGPTSRCGTGSRPAGAASRPAIASASSRWTDGTDGARGRRSGRCSPRSRTLAGRASRTSASPPSGAPDPWGLAVANVLTGRRRRGRGRGDAGRRGAARRRDVRSGDRGRGPRRRARRWHSARRRHGPPVPAGSRLRVPGGRFRRAGVPRLRGGIVADRVLGSASTWPPARTGVAAARPRPATDSGPCDMAGLDASAEPGQRRSRPTHQQRQGRSASSPARTLGTSPTTRRRPSRRRRRARARRATGWASGSTIARGRRPRDPVPPHRARLDPGPRQGGPIIVLQDGPTIGGTRWSASSRAPAPEARPGPPRRRARISGRRTPNPRATPGATSGAVRACGEALGGGGSGSGSTKAPAAEVQAGLRRG